MSKKFTETEVESYLKNRNTCPRFNCDGKVIVTEEFTEESQQRTCQCVKCGNMFYEIYGLVKIEKCT